MPITKMPKTIGAMVDELYRVRLERLAKAKEVEALQARETALREHIIATLPKSEATGAAGKTARASIVVKTQPRVEDWDKFYEYVHRNKAYELLQKRVSNAAVEERWEHGKEVPGVGHFNVVSISLNKL